MFYVSRALYDFRNWTRRISSLLNRLVVTKISVTELVFKKSNLLFKGTDNLCSSKHCLVLQNTGRLF